MRKQKKMLVCVCLSVCQQNGLWLDECVQFFHQSMIKITKQYNYVLIIIRKRHFESWGNKTKGVNWQHFLRLKLQARHLIPECSSGAAQWLVLGSSKVWMCATVWMWNKVMLKESIYKQQNLKVVEHDVMWYHRRNGQANDKLVCIYVKSDIYILCFLCFLFFCRQLL